MHYYFVSDSGAAGRTDSPSPNINYGIMHMNEDNSDTAVGIFRRDEANKSSESGVSFEYKSPVISGERKAADRDDLMIVLIYLKVFCSGMNGVGRVLSEKLGFTDTGISYGNNTLGYDRLFTFGSSGESCRIMVFFSESSNKITEIMKVFAGGDILSLPVTAAGITDVILSVYGEKTETDMTCASAVMNDFPLELRTIVGSFEPVFDKIPDISMPLGDKISLVLKDLEVIPEEEEYQRLKYMSEQLEKELRSRRIKCLLSVTYSLIILSIAALIYFLIR